MSRPLLTAEIAFGSGYATPPVFRAFTDVTPWVEANTETEIRHGRDDEEGTASPGELRLLLNNDDGRFTPDRAASPYSPNVKKGKPIRVGVRYAEDGPANILQGDDATFATSKGSWSAGGSVPPSLSWVPASGYPAADGALLITWGTGGTLPLANVVMPQLVIGRKYVATVYVYVPTGSPGVLMLCAGNFGAAPNVKNAWVPISVTFTCNDPFGLHQLQVWPATGPTSGQQAYVGAATVDEQIANAQTAPLTTTPLSAVRSLRFTGYTDEFQQVWPMGDDRTCQARVTASTRRSRIGHAPPLPSTTRAAILETFPMCYWPMDDDTTVVDSTKRQSFRDATNIGTPLQDREVIAAFGSPKAFTPVKNYPGAPLVDQLPLVYFPPTDLSAIATLPQYVGSGTTTTIPAGDITIESVAVVQPEADQILRQVGGIWSSDQRHQLNMYVARDGEGLGYVAFSNVYRDVNVETGVTDSQYIQSAGAPGLGAPYNNDLFNDVVDGAPHHFCMTLTGGTTCTMYVDGVYAGQMSLSGGRAFNRPWSNIVIGNAGANAPAYIGHFAVHKYALNPTQIYKRAQRATAATAGLADRVRIVGELVGIPADEITVDPSIAAPLGPQLQAGRNAVDVLAEIETSTDGLLIDDRDGTLHLYARNARHNAPLAFSLSTATGEIEPDVTPTSNDRYLCNYVQVTRGGTDTPLVLKDQPSIDEHGIYDKQVTLLTAWAAEAEAAGLELLRRGATPKTRLTQVSVDVSDLSVPQRQKVLAAFVSSRFETAGLPSQAPATVMAHFIEGYTETVSITGGHLLTMNTTPADDVNVYEIGHPTRGVIGAGYRIPY